MARVRDRIDEEDEVEAEAEAEAGVGAEAATLADDAMLAEGAKSGLSNAGGELAGVNDSDANSSSVSGES